MEVEVAHCQGCGAILPFDGIRRTIVCEYCGTSNTISSTNVTHETELIEKARHWRKLGRPDKALKYYTQAVDENPFDPNVCYEFLEAATKDFSEKAYFLSELDALKDAWACTINSGIDYDRLVGMISYMKEVINFAQEHNHSDDFLYTYSHLLEDATDALS